MNLPGHFTRRLLQATSRLGRTSSLVAVACLLAHCAHQTPVTVTYRQPRLGDTRFVSHDGTAFGYRHWAKSATPADTVVIGLHGFCGASIDFENFGQHVASTRPNTAVYAYELRGQGNDPLRSRRGDIDDPANWSRDLLTFTSLVRHQHPDAKIVWFGESMGALIAANTYRECVAKDPCQPPCDALVLSSPVVAIRGDFPRWKKDVLFSLARIAPRARLSLDVLAGGQAVPMTHSSTHAEQSETNSWNIEAHTLRLLAALGGLIEGMDQAATSFRGPVLIAHGGKDFFTSRADVEDFRDHMTRASRTQSLYYPDSYHLLMYDNDREKVIDDVADWIGRLSP